MGDPSPADGASLWRKLGGKVRRSPRTLGVLLAPRIRRRTQAIERQLNRRRFSATRRALQRRNPDGTGLVLNTRLVEPTIPSIAHWADWSLTRHGFFGDLRTQPRLLFVKAVPECLEQFLECYLPRIAATTRFVLITGDADTTLPRQVDQRFPDYIVYGLEQRLLRLPDDPRLLHWYAENLDTPLHGVTPIPLGCINSDGHGLFRQTLAEIAPVAIRERPLKAFCAHYVRKGPQWENRRAVMRLATGDWSAFVEVHEQIPYDDFFPTLQRYPFVICAGGGGLDPCPKAFTALLAGAIPIIERNPTTAAYGDLPVAYVDRWDSHSLSPARLEAWRDALHPRFEDPAQRRGVLERMSMAHWLRRIGAHHPGA